MNKLPRMAMMAWLLAWPAMTAASSCDSLESARWLLGDWIAGGETTEFHESWVIRGPRDFEGSGSERSKADGRVVGSEVLRLVEMAGGVYYIAKVTHNELPVAFRLTACDGDRMVFENPAHDFPRRLEYRHESDGQMIVAVSDGQDKRFTLDFQRRAQATGTDGSAMVVAAEDARFAAMVGADTAELGPWLADGLQYVHSSGQVETREQFLESIASGALRYLGVTPLERQVIMLGDRAAFVRGRGRFQVATGEARLDLQIRYLSVYTESDGRWRLRAWQSLRMPPEPGGEPTIIPAF